MRVNARLEDSYEVKFAYLQEATQLCVSDIVRESIDRYYETVKAEQVRKRSSLDELVGAFQSLPGTPADLSTNYKEYIGQIIEEKYPQHAHRG